MSRPVGGRQGAPQIAPGSRRSLLRVVLAELPRSRARSARPTSRAIAGAVVKGRRALRTASASRSHEDAVRDAEVRLLIDKLVPFGVLAREELARRAEAHLWRSGTFAQALRAGVRAGALELLPGDFVALARLREAKAASAAPARQRADASASTER
jgi:hypothetical protein